MCGTIINYHQRERNVLLAKRSNCITARIGSIPVYDHQWYWLGVLNLCHRRFSAIDFAHLWHCQPADSIRLKARSTSSVARKFCDSQPEVAKTVEAPTSFGFQNDFCILNILYPRLSNKSVTDDG